jgi:signal peptidase II
MILGIVFIILGILIDQIVKILIRVNMFEGQEITLISHFFSITHVENTGAAWGGFSGYTVILIIISILILGYFIFMYKDINFKDKKFFSISLVLVIGGTIGNLIDRLFFRSVTDFLDFDIFGYDFPVFNIADILLVIGFAMFIINMIFLEKDDEKPVKSNASETVEEIKQEELTNEETINIEEDDNEGNN